MTIRLTPAAVAALQRTLSTHSQALGIRLSIQAGGCAGLSYRLEAIQEVPAEDRLFEVEGIRIWVPAAHLPFIEGLEIDHPQGLADRGFVFHNPQARQTCGCGTSFAV